jgi:tRNA splicing endonuclease
MSNKEEKVDASNAWEERVLIVRRHFERKGYRVHSGLQFGCELVLYADDPSRVHSDFCVHVVPEGKPIIEADISRAAV